MRTFKLKIDKIKNNENIIEALYKIMNDERMNKIRILLAMDNKQHNRTIKLSELKEVIE